MQVFFQELYSHIDKNSGKNFEDMFLVKLASKGTSLNRLWSSPVFFALKYSVNCWRHFRQFSDTSPSNEIDGGGLKSSIFFNRPM